MFRIASQKTGYGKIRCLLPTCYGSCSEVCTGVCTLTCRCCVPLHVLYMCLCKQTSVYCKRGPVKSSVCPSFHSLPPLLHTHHACWSCLTLLSSTWPPAGTTLVLSFKDHLLEDIKVTERGSWWPAAVTCSSAGSEGSGHGREGWSLSTVLGAVQRGLRQESAWSTAAHCRQLSECLVPVWSLDRRRCGELAGLTVVLTPDVTITPTDDPPLMTCPIP